MLLASGFLIGWATIEGCIGSGELSDDSYLRLMVKVEGSDFMCAFVNAVEIILSTSEDP